MTRFIKKIIWLGILAVLIVSMISVVSRLSGKNDGRGNFSFFWLAGRMVLEGENPYDQTQYLAGHDQYNITWRPNKIFPYPLPLALFCIPLGFLSLENAYLAWQVATLLILSYSVYRLLNHWDSDVHRRLFIPLIVALFFFGPVYLTLRIGAIGAFSLLIILGVILLYKSGNSVWAGILLALTILKPPQGAPIILLACVWFLARRDWKAIYGVMIGGVALLIIGLIQDPLWIVKFRHASEAVMDRTLGVHSNIWAFSYLACQGDATCSTFFGATGGLILLLLSGFFLWKNHADLSAWEAMNLIIPIGFVSTVYLWAYDQILYIVPIVWIVGTLVKKTKSYIHAFLFLIILVFYAFFAVAKLSEISHDLWSLGNTIIVLISLFIANKLKQKA